MTLDSWPIRALTPSKGGRPVYTPRNTAGGPSSISGVVQVTAPDAGIWMVTYEAIPLRGWPQIQIWDAIALRLEGRLNPILVPVWEGRRQPWADGQEPYPPIPHDDGSLFSDGSGYYQPAIAAEVAADAALRATSMTITMLLGGAIQPAQFFSVGDRLHQISRVTSATDIGGGATTYDVRFLPPLRESVTAGDVVEFQEPVCKMRLAADNAMDRSGLELNRFGTPNVSFVEDLG